MIFFTTIDRTFDFVIHKLEPIRYAIPQTFTSGGQQVMGSFNITNGFNEFFTSVGLKLARTFDDVDAEAFEQYPHPITLEKTSPSVE